MNSKSFFIGLMLIATLPSACSDDHLSMRSCVNKVLKDNGMEPYTNQEIGCNFFITPHTLPGKQYFLLNNQCADMSPFRSIVMGVAYVRIPKAMVALIFIEMRITLVLLESRLISVRV